MLSISEYCKTRSFPTVKKSEYLNTIGEKLHPDIDILWTGNYICHHVWIIDITCLCLKRKLQASNSDIVPLVECYFM